jgi:hypothetical protein
MKKYQKHQSNHKRIFIAILILTALICMIIGPMAKANQLETATAVHVLQHNVPIVTIIKSIIIA